MKERCRQTLETFRKRRVQANGAFVVTNMKLCMSPHWVSSLLERSCLVPAVSFLSNNQNEGFAQTHQGKAMFIR